MRIWDLRRGDADDDRTSPAGRGLRSVVLGVVLEFNYLQASIGLLALIVGPALLVGLAPSVVVTYGRLKVHAVTSVGDSPIVALVLLAGLVGAALWIGRPFLAMAVDYFWQLHYTLVLPLFVAVRELLRALMERWRGRSIPPDQLERERRVGTVLAALLLGGGGLTLAMLVEVSLGLQRVDIVEARIWAVAEAALGNAAVILGLSTAVESLYWIWRELSLKGPVLDWVPTTSNADASIVRIAHLSDLHLVGERYGYRMEAGTHGPRGNRCMRRAWRKLAALHAVTPVERVLVTGDITDAGTRAEWAELLDMLRGCPELRARLSFVPGNHDVNIIDRNNPARLELPWSAGQSLRQLRVVLALDAIQGERAHVVDRASGTLGPLLKDYLRDGNRAERLRALAQRGTLRGRLEMTKVWHTIFPLVEPPRAGEGYGVISLNSNARSHFALTNAIGVVNPSQLRALKLVLQKHPHHAWIILLHHHVVQHPEESISLRERIGLALVNAPDVLAALAPHAARILVLHGHRHRDWIGAYGEVVLCSAPSATLGADGADKYRGSFHVHDLAFGVGESVRLTRTERVQVGQPRWLGVHRVTLLPGKSSRVRVPVGEKRVLVDDGGAVLVRSDWREREKVIRPDLIELQARRNGITRAEVAQALESSFEGRVVGFYREPGGAGTGVYPQETRLLPIIARPPLAEREDVSVINSLQIWSPVAGRMIPMTQVTSGAEVVWEDPIVMRRDRFPTLTVHADPRAGLPSQLFNRVRSKIEQIEVPPGYSLEWGGEYEDSRDARAALAKPLPYGLALMVFIVVCLFNSIRTTVLIQLIMPLVVIGVTTGLLLTGMPFGFMALLGVLSVGGEQIKNQIVVLSKRVHHDLGYTVPSTKGGPAHVTVSRSPHAYDRGVRVDEFDCGRVRCARATL